MAFQWGDVQRLKQELGYNAANVGAEAYVLNSYIAVFDAAIQPYLVDQGTTSTTPVQASPPSAPQNVQLTLATNPPVTGQMVGSQQYGACFQVGTRIVVDVGPQQENDVIVQAIAGLVITVALQNAHGTGVPNGAAQYPISVQSAEAQVRDILRRLDAINLRLKARAPAVAGIAKADEVEFFASKRGKNGQKGVTDDLIAQRDWARKDLAALLGVQNLWDLRGRFGDSGGGAGGYAPF
jgi:hypothetical protein